MQKNMVGKPEPKQTTPGKDRGNMMDGKKDGKMNMVKAEDMAANHRARMEGDMNKGGRPGGRGGPGGRGRGGFGNRDRGDHGGRGGHRGGGHGGHGGQQHQHHQSMDQSTMEALMEGLDGQPQPDKKFTGRCRLFVGNLTNDVSEDDFKKMFEPHGEFTEVFLNASRGFGFIRMDMRKNAEAAKAALDGLQRKGRTLRVRFATHGAALKVKYLTPHVSNELLAQSFSMFGEVERAVIIVDDRGKPTGEGVVEFARKPGAQAALKRISEGVFMLGTSPRPIVVEPLEQKDEEDGYPEKFIQKSQEFNKEREQAPRFAPPGSFEFEFGQKWKDLYNLCEEGERGLKRQFEEGVAKLELEQAGALMEHQTNMLRQDLLRRQEELRRLEEMQQMEMQKRMGMRLNTRRDEEVRRRAQEDDHQRRERLVRERVVDERRQQELYAQERAMRELHERGERGAAPPMQPPPAPPTGMGLERGRQAQASKAAMGMAGEGGRMPGNSRMEAQQAEGYRNNGMQSAQPRQSRFDQPPGYSQGASNASGGVGGGPTALMGGMGPGRMGGGSGPLANERERMERARSAQDRNMRDEYFEAKRARRY